MSQSTKTCLAERDNKLIRGNGVISDVLADALDRIREYLDDPVYATMYDGELRNDIERVVQQMERLRVELDRPPAPGSAPSEGG